MKYVSFDDFFNVLGNKQRVNIVRYLDREGPKSVSAISQDLKMEQSAVSHNMSRLLLCHFVNVKREGKERIYAVNEDTIRPLLALIDKHVRTYCVKGCSHLEEGSEVSASL
jgi:DNA-binding transcriptional ArsR family regulator